MKSLDRKLARDLWSLKTQVVSIALVIACGIGGFIGSFSTYGSLLWSRDNYYATARFPHIFATAKRGAPLVEMADPRSLEAVVDVLSQEAVAVRPGMPARFELGQGVPLLGARVRLIEPAAFTKVSALGVEEQRVNVVLDFAEPLDVRRNNLEAMVEDGLKPGDRVVVYPSDALKDGSRVEIRSPR